jgi:hypothetical protein
MRIYLDSTLHILYLTYSIVPECTCLRDEDTSYIPIQNVGYLKRPKCHEELKNAEAFLRGKLKEFDKSSDERKIVSSLMNRVKIRREFVKLLEQQVSDLIFILSIFSLTLQIKIDMKI